jgi:hypothetical protein
MAWHSMTLKRNNSTDEPIIIIAESYHYAREVDGDNDGKMSPLPVGTSSRQWQSEISNQMRWKKLEVILQSSS